MEKPLLTTQGRAAAAAIACCVLTALGVFAPGAAARAGFQPRIGNALGLVPPVGGPDIAVGSSFPAVYHGGPVMREVTIHTIFWAPRGYAFEGSPAPGVLGYEPLVQRFLTDIAHDSGQLTNIYSVLNEYGDGSGSGAYRIAYSPAANSIDDANPYPPASRQCPSPQGVATCVTDVELQQEIDRVIESSGGSARGLTNLWVIFLPPNVDTCDAPGSCASNTYAGYHSIFDLGNGVTVYAVIPDPLIEGTVSPGSDPQGNPDAESAIGAVAHEAAEAITDPLGNGWMDPNGFEVGDLCESGPEVGIPLGYAPDGSPYNQLINGEEWLIQDMWSNASHGCVQSSTASSTALPLPQVHLQQFSSAVSGSIATAKGGVSVRVSLERASTVVGRARTSTRSDGAWGPVSLKSLTRAPVQAFGDDRDRVHVDYGPGGPPNDTILTGNGGDPFTASGWTGWFDLDHGFSVASGFGGGGVILGPCFQTGVLDLSIDHTLTESPTNLCGTETGAAIIATGPIAPGAVLRLQSEDNRAAAMGNLNGALVSLTVSLGEANSVSQVANDQVLFQPSGFPTCAANLRSQRITCTGLVPGTRYTLVRRRGHTTLHPKADGQGSTGALAFPGPRAVMGGDVVTLRNGAHRTLTALHVAHLRVDIMGAQTVIASGTCEAGEYYGPALSAPPINAAVGAPGIAGQGQICPPDGHAKGLPAAHIEQTDDLSGGETFTEVPQLSFTSPANGGAVYGAFTVLAGAGIPTPRHAVLASGARVAVTITRGAGGPRVFRAASVNTAAGAHVPALAPGVYAAKWVLSDAGGDTRTVLTRFVEEG